MSRQIRILWVAFATVSLMASGCHPTQPFYFLEDGDLSHYVGSATQIEQPDVNEPKLDEVHASRPPLTLSHTEIQEIWDLTLEEAVNYALANSRVMRDLGGLVVGPSETLNRNPEGVQTIYDSAIVESGNGRATGSRLSGTGVEAALSEFDAQFTTNILWEKNDFEQNVLSGGFGGFFDPTFQQDRATFDVALSKKTASGSQLTIRNTTIYDQNNRPTRAEPSDWDVQMDLEFRHPLLQGSGVEFNQIAGAGGGAGGFNGVVIARIRQDMTLADFEAGVRNLVRDVEFSYWQLYFTYRDLQAKKDARKQARKNWEIIDKRLKGGGIRGTTPLDESMSRGQFFRFQNQVQQALSTLYSAENTLRLVMGLGVSDGRLIRPATEPTTAKDIFNWDDVHLEALTRGVELRKQKWNIKKRELELLAAKNFLLPRLDFVGRYRFRGLGDHLLRKDRTGSSTFSDSYAFEKLTSGDNQEWQLGLELSFPIGYRKELAGVRHHQLLLMRERAVLREMELELSHQVADAVRNLDKYYALIQTNFNQMAATEKQVKMAEKRWENAKDATLHLNILLNSYQLKTEAELAYYLALMEYNKAITMLHYRKGSLLEYDGVYLAEGPWPGKANFDAHRRARRRDASFYLDYGITRPGVFSQGPLEQLRGSNPSTVIESVPLEAIPDEPEEINTPQPENGTNDPQAGEVPSRALQMNPPSKQNPKHEIISYRSNGENYPSASGRKRAQR